MSVRNKIQKKGAIFIIAVLAAAALFLANFLLHRHFIRWDLTAEKEHTLSDSTKKILNGLKDQVTVTLYFTSPLPAGLAEMEQNVNDLLEEYRVYSDGRVSVRRVIPEESAKKEQETQIIGIPPVQLNVVQRDRQEVQKVYLGMAIFYGDKKEVLPVVANIPNLEYAVTSGILKLTADKMPAVGLVLPQRLEGDQSPYALIQKVLGEQVTLKALKADASDWKDIDALVMLEPKEVAASVTAELDRLLAAQIPVILFTGTVDVQPDLQAQNYATGLEDWLLSKGVTLSKEVLIDPKKMGRAAFYTGVTQYSIPYPFFVKADEDSLDKDHPATGGLEEIVFPWTNVLTVNAESHADWSYKTLARSSGSSFLQDGPPVVNPDVFNTLEIKPGQSYPLAVAIETPGPEKSSRLVVVANSRLIENNFLTDYRNNILFLQNLVDWASTGEQLIGIRSRGKNTRPIETPFSETIALIRWSLLVGIPLLVIAIGGIVALVRRRRHRKLSEVY